MVRYIAEAGRIARDSIGDGTCGTTGADDQANSADTVIFGSLGPLVESYRPDMVMEHASGEKIYRMMAQALSPYVDCFLAETMSSIEEASQTMEAVGKLSPESKHGIMISFTLNKDGSIRSGESASEGIHRIANFAHKFDVHRKCHTIFLFILLTTIEVHASGIHTSRQLQLPIVNCILKCLKMFLHIACFNSLGCVV